MCVRCEAIICGERKGDYMFVISFVLTNTPLCSADSVLIFTGDVFFTQEMVIFTRLASSF